MVFGGVCRGGREGGWGRLPTLECYHFQDLLTATIFYATFGRGGRYFREGDCSFQKFTVALWVMAVLEPYYYAPVPKIIAVRIVKWIITWKNTFLLAL